MWCDDFDMDLYKAVPGAREVLAPVKDVVLYTHSHVTDGVINCPSAWNGDIGLISFFGFSDAAKPPSYVTEHPIVRCTFEEAVRDLWCHQSAMLVERRLVWHPERLRREFDAIMWHLRGWRDPPLPEPEIERTRRDVIGSIGAAVNRLRAALAAYRAATEEPTP